MGLYVAQRHHALPHCMLRQVTTGTVCGTGVYTPITFDTADMDPFGMFTLNGSSITIKVPGMYLCEGTVNIPASASSFRLFAALQYSAAQWRGTSVLTIVSGNPTTGVSRLMRFNTGDVVKIALFQDSGGNKTTGAGTENSPYFNVAYQHA